MSPAPISAQCRAESHIRRSGLLSIDRHDASRPAAAGREIAWPWATGEMAERVRTLAWERTPLGPIADWSDRLKAVVDLVLAAPLPMTLHWGDRRVQIYNDAAREVFGQRHPQALGQTFEECWPDLREVIAPIHARVTAGEAVVLTNQCWTYARHGGAPEDFYFTNYFIPLTEGAEGGAKGVTGFLVAAIETTAEVLGGADRRASEAALRESQAGLQAAGDLVGLTSYRWDPTTGRLHWPRRLKALWGLPSDAEVDQRMWLEGIHPEDRGRVQLAAERALEPDGDGVYAIQYRVTGHSGGPERWISTYGRMVFEDRQPVSFTGAVLEVTQQKRVEAQLRRSEGYLAAILRQAPVGVAVFGTDSRLMMGNAALDRFEIGETPSADPQGTRWRAFRTDGSPLARDQYPAARALRGEVTMPGVDFLHRRESGAEVWTRVGAAPLRDAAGDVCGVVAIYEDIDQQRRYEDRLRYSEERFRRFAENSADVMWIYDVVGGRLEYVSPGFQRAWGIPPEQVIADRGVWIATLHPEDRDGVLAALQRVLSEGETVSHEYRIVRPDGAVRRIRDTGFPIRDVQGRVVQAGGIAQDITRDVPPTVYLVDPDPESRAAKADLLRGAGQRVTPFASEQAFLEVAGALTPGCVVARTQDLGAARFELVGALKARRISLPVILETSLGGDVALAISAMKAGAADLLESPCRPEALLDAVASALAGLSEVLEDEEATQLAQTQVALMSSREREVLEGLLSGGTNKTIARNLGISPRTVENHRARVMERLGAHTLPEAVLAAASAGVKPTRRRSSKADPG